MALVARQIHWLGRTCFTAEQMSPTLAGVLEEEEPPPADDEVVGLLGDGEVVELLGDGEVVELLGDDDVVELPLEDEPEHGLDEQYVPQ